MYGLCMSVASSAQASASIGAIQVSDQLEEHPLRILSQRALLHLLRWRFHSRRSIVLELLLCVNLSLSKGGDIGEEFGTSGSGP